MLKDLQKIQTNIDKLYKIWSDTSHKKLLKLEPSFIELCSNLCLPQFTFEEDLQNFILDSRIEKISNLVTVTDNRAKRKSMENTVTDIESDDDDSFFDESDIDNGECLNSDFSISTSDPSLDNSKISTDTPLLDRFSNLDDSTETQTDPVLDNFEKPQANENDSNSNTQKKAKMLDNGRLEGIFVSENVFNLSNKLLNEHHISLLSKGLNFCPTPTCLNKGEIKDDLENFSRRMRLKYHFKDQPTVENTSQFKPKSRFNPKNENQVLETYLKCVENSIMDVSDKGKSFSNLSKEEWEALSDLQNDKSIVIKPADKGSAVVVWDRADYIKEAAGQLFDKEVYTEIDSDPSKIIEEQIENCLNEIKARGDLNEETLAYFKVKEAKLGRFYLQPKIHKRLGNVPGRPVISNSGYYTENISSFLDAHLQPLTKQVKSFIQDTKDFLNKLNKLPKLPKGSRLCTIDVVGLYPNIPHELGLKAMRTFLDKRSDKSVSTQTLIDLAELVLKNNYFTHDEKIFKQIRGTAMGTRFAPSYAILAMAEFEELALSNSELNPETWWRFIDDIFLIWLHGEQSYKQFLDYLNSLHPTLKFTSTDSENKAEFLDVHILNENGHLETDLFVKSTDTHQYLHSKSCHRFHTKAGIPYGQALRLRRIVSNEAKFESRCSDLRSWLVKRGFEGKMVDEQIDKAKSLNRETLLVQEKKQGEQAGPMLSLRYHPILSSNVHKILKNLHPILHSNDDLKKVFEKIPMTIYRRAKNIKDHLVRAVLPQISQLHETGSYKCLKPRCQTCQNVQVSKEFTNADGSKTFEIRNGPLNCSTPNVVYQISCKTCNVQYVGSSKGPFRLRFNNYKSHHRAFLDRMSKGTLGTGKSVPQRELHSHFAQSDHNGIEDMQFTLIDSGPNNVITRKRETFWQYKLETFEPKGLNIRNVPPGEFA